MTRKWTAAVVVAVAWAGSGAARAQGADAFRQAVEYAREKVYPALVNIAVVAEEHSGGRIEHFPAAGSGVIVSPAGHVVTNFHVAGNTARIKCTLPSGETIDARIVAADPMTDLCILQLDLEKRDDTTIPIPFATIGDSEQLDVGDHVIAVGNPLTLSSSMTLGIISNKSRVFTDFTGTELDEMDVGDGESTGIFNQWIQHDALILPGNSGGPLVNLKGDVIGINTRGGGGVGFAIPSRTVKHVLNQALTFREVRRGWLGVSVLPVGKAGLKHGALVSYVWPGSPAERAGLQAGDILRSLGGQPTDVRFFDEVPPFHQRVAELPAGAKVALSVERGGKTLELSAEVARLEKMLGEPAQFAKMGLNVRAVTTAMAIARKFPDAKGVLITGVRPGYPIEDAKPSVPTGAVITHVDGKEVGDLESFKQLLGEAEKQPKFSVTFRNDDEVLVTMIETAEDKEQRGGKELPKAWLGLKTQVLTDKVAEAVGLSGRKGFRVTQVYPETRAADAGLKVGDVLVGLDGDALDAAKPQDAEDLRRLVEDMSIGDDAEFEVLRDGKSLKVTVELQESPASALDVKKAKQKEFEFDVRETTFIDRVQQKWPKGEVGVLVTAAESGGWANVAGLRINDLLMSVNGASTPDVAAFEKQMTSILEQKPRIITLFVRRGAKTHFVFIEPDWTKVQVAK